MRAILIRLGVLVIIGSCTENQNEVNYRNYYHYPNDTLITSEFGTPKDSSVFYFPAKIDNDSNVAITKIDTFNNRWYSAVLKVMEEPVLYNFYLKREIYRLLMLPSFKYPTLISINNVNGEIFLTTKVIDRVPDLFDEMTEIAVFNPSGEYKKKDTLIKPNKSAKIIFNSTKKVDVNKWNDFILILEQSNYWEMKNTIEKPGNDGMVWILEAHTNRRYWFVDRWQPEEKAFKKVCKYLIELSDLDKVDKTRLN